MDVADVAGHLSLVRERSPLVQCITNFVAMDLAANALLAVGASPAMVSDPAESGEFAAIAGALTVNIGTPSPRWVEGMQVAASAAVEQGRPWVLDPVAVGATALRNEICLDLLGRRPTIIRANASEVLALAQVAGLGEIRGSGRGVDSADAVDDALGAAKSLAERYSCVVAVTGEVDFITDGARFARVHGGSDLMPRVTATGCALTAVTGAFAVMTGDPFTAATSACAVFAAAGARAGRSAGGPGSWRWRFLDELHLLGDAADLRRDVRIEESLL